MNFFIIIFLGLIFSWIFMGFYQWYAHTYFALRRRIGTIPEEMLSDILELCDGAYSTVVEEWCVVHNKRLMDKQIVDGRESCDDQNHISNGKISSKHFMKQVEDVMRYVNYKKYFE